jgi:MFS family permease
MIASMSGFSIKGKLITAGSFAMPIFLLVFSAVHWLPFSLLTLMGIGWGFLVLANASNALLQNQVPDDLRGRVMSIYMLSFFGLMPIGSLMAGSVAEWVGEPLTVAIGATLLLTFAGLVWLRVPELRREG